MWKGRTWWSHPAHPHFSPCSPSHTFSWRRPCPLGSRSSSFSEVYLLLLTHSLVWLSLHTHTEM